ncbi:MAG: hypothetical protein M0Z31_01795 [Clostridia bacterium]|nr:hypothetical protein [Clostridia bacterium]
MIKEHLPEDREVYQATLANIEKVLKEMKDRHHPDTYRGAYHVNPDYTHWYGNAELKMDGVGRSCE